MAQGLVMISAQTLASAVASVSFNNVPSIYKDLYIVATVLTNTATNPRLQYNGDTANLSYVYMMGNGTVATTGTNVDAAMVGSANSTQWGVMSINILDYSATDKHKSAISHSASPDANVSYWATRWASTAAINSFILLSGVGTTFSSGSKFYLYGVIG